MDPLVQWGITIIASILSFFAGRAAERNRLAQANRLKLLEPVEDWVAQASRLVGIVGDELSAISQGLPAPVGYTLKDRVETGKSLAENKPKILGILKSEALKTRGTRTLASRLSELVPRLDLLIEREYLQAYHQLFDKIQKREDPQTELLAVLAIAVAASSLIQEIHGVNAELKTKFN